MKTHSITKQVCVLTILALTPGAYAQAPSAPVTTAKTAQASSESAEDPLGDWIEKNADRFGLTIDKVPRAKAAPDKSKTPTSNSTQSTGRAVTPKAQNGGVVTIPSQYQPIPISMAPTASSAGASAPSATASTPSSSASAAQSGSDPITAFIVNRVIDMPPSASQSQPFASTPMTDVPGANTVRNTTVSLENFVSPPIVETPVPEVAIEKKVFAPPPEAAASASAAAQISAVMKDLDFAKTCSPFATESGFGPWGKAVIQELVDGNANTLLQGTDDLRRACPSYDYLSIVQKSHVWVSVLASMAFLESTCDPKANGRGPDGTAAGLLQLHAGFENRAAPGCNRQDSRKPISSLRCTISIIEEQVKRTSLLFSRDTHFGVLRPQGDWVNTKRGKRYVVKARLIVSSLRELPLCQRK